MAKEFRVLDSPVGNTPAGLRRRASEMTVETERSRLDRVECHQMLGAQGRKPEAYLKYAEDLRPQRNAADAALDAI